MAQSGRILPLLLAGLFWLVVGVAATSKPDVINLPTGFFSKGIAIDGDTVYVGTIYDSLGQIWKGSIKTGEGTIVAEDTTPAYGVEYDRRSQYLFVGGGYQGTARVYDHKFRVVADLTLSTSDGSSLIVDVVITKNAAYFVDALLPQYYKVSLDRESGRLKSSEVETIPISGDIEFTPGTFNINGVEASKDGKALLVINVSTGVLSKVDAGTGIAATVDLGGGTLQSGDGLVLRGNTLWVVQNGFFGGDLQVSEVSLSSDFSCGYVSPRVLTSDRFVSPAGIAFKASSLFVVNGNFVVPAEDRPTTDTFEVIRLGRDGGDIMCSS